MPAAPTPPGARVRERLGEAAELTAARVGVSPRALLGLLVVVALVLAVLGGRVVLADRRSVPEPIPATAPSLAASSLAAPVPTEPSVPTVLTPTATSTGAARVAVHVVGQVRHPGVVQLPAGARVQQALAAAGGPLGTADLARVNLARVVVDGEQVVVPRPGEAAAPASGPVAPGAGAGTSPVVGPVDLNSAGAADLDALPGVGPVLAQRILDWRGQHGRFSSVEELGEVSGIGEAVLGRLRPLVRV